jgi:hypothetical protein
MRHNELTSIGREPGLAGPFDTRGPRDDFGTGKYYVEPASAGSGFRRRKRDKSYIDPDDLTPSERAQLRIQMDRNQIARDRDAAYGAAARDRDTLARERELQRQREALRRFEFDKDKEDYDRDQDTLDREQAERERVEDEREAVKKAEAVAEEKARTDPTRVIDDMREAGRGDVADSIESGIVHHDVKGRLSTKRFITGMTSIADAAEAAGEDPAVFVKEATAMYGRAKEAQAKFDDLKAGEEHGYTIEELVELGKDVEFLARHGITMDPSFGDEIEDALETHKFNFIKP